ncbi:PilZ domain-containing protein [Devosia nitrariae]|uniref:PilZ domain-containing protein n=1 Tax=Devosia nitrariae TaxID=2071872 RepID=A0ABQ5WCI0_9HYPH|nr:PilZ domain-containing protein [Devosia nitrariae]GLQ57842.1 hypothetical protein GCM10010862_51010 [Devosia nitrariae]
MAAALVVHAPLLERRRHPRNTCHTDATVVLDEGLTRLPADIVDISPAGAKLELPEVLDLPRKFYMLFNHQIAP